MQSLKWTLSIIIQLKRDDVIKNIIKRRVGFRDICGRGVRSEERREKSEMKWELSAETKIEKQREKGVI